MAIADAGGRFADLLSLMARLRGPSGCPWDREQTRASLRPFLLEEAYEVLDALDREDAAGLEEELGDLLFQVVFQAQIARERGEFSMESLLAVLTEKMTRRHPHVFGDRSIETAGEALAQWERIKRAENGGRQRSVLEGVPRSLPGLLRAQRIQDRAARVGFDWPDATAALEKVSEEAGEVAGALEAKVSARIEAEIGDLLFAAVNVARLAAVDPEAALQGATERFRARFQHMETLAEREGRDLTTFGPGEMERLWDDAKAREPGAGRP